MNGETVLLCPNMINIPINTNMMMMGVSHQAFLSFRKDQSSAIKDLLFPIFKFKTN